jgi:hypothetical protein
MLVPKFIIFFTTLDNYVTFTLYSVPYCLYTCASFFAVLFCHVAFIDLYPQQVQPRNPQG